MENKRSHGLGDQFRDQKNPLFPVLRFEKPTTSKSQQKPSIGGPITVTPTQRSPLSPPPHRHLLLLTVNAGPHIYASSCFSLCPCLIVCCFDCSRVCTHQHVAYRMHTVRVHQNVKSSQYASPTTRTIPLRSSNALLPKWCTAELGAFQVDDARGSE